MTRKDYMFQLIISHLQAETCSLFLSLKRKDYMFQLIISHLQAETCSLFLSLKRKALVVLDILLSLLWLKTQRDGYRKKIHAFNLEACRRK
jgi:hypothetical protein